METLSTENEIRQALSQLPETLDETYERILNSIPHANRKYALRLFQWLSADSMERETLDVLARAVTVPDEQGIIREEDQLLSPEKLQEICRCLIAVHDDDLPVAFAHYTVKEYLFSDRIKTGSSKYYSISEATVNAFAAKTAINYLLNVDYAAFRNGDKVLTLSESKRIDPFLSFAVILWDHYTRSVEKDGGDTEITNLTLLLLNPSGSHFQGFSEQNNVHIAETDPDDLLPDWKICPGAEHSAILG